MDGRRQQIDLARHKTWDHGYAETVYSAQSKTYDRVYVLAPVRSPLVNGQNYYTAITRARFGVKLWTEDPKRLAERLERHSGEKSSALEGLGRLDRDSIKARSLRHSVRLDRLRAEQLAARAERMAGIGRHDAHPAGPFARLARYIAANATETAQSFDRYFAHLLARGGENGRDGPIPDSSSVGSENRRDTLKGLER
jgi:hypothetical protein